MTDLQCLVQDIDNLLQCRPEHELGVPPLSVTEVLSRAKDAVLSMECMIAYDFSKVTSNGNQMVDRSSWVLAERKVQKMRKRVKTVKASLASALALLSS